MTNIKGNFPKVVNGDTVIGFTNSKKIKELGWMDVASLSSWYQEDPDKNHLGVIDLFSSMANISLPSYRNLWKDKSVLNVNGADGKFTYDLPVEKDMGCYTLGDTSNKYEAAGIDGSTFEIGLDRQFRKGDVLTYDAMYGEQLIVSEEHEVRKEGDTFFHTVQLVELDKGKWYPNDKLKKGIQYFKIGHATGEYGTDLSGISANASMGTLKCEFQLGNHRGAETFQTMYAGMKSFSGATMHSKKFWDYFQNQQEMLGQDSMGRSNDMFFAGKINKETGKVSKDSVKVGGSMEYLVLLECMKLEAHQLMFQKAGVISDTNGTKRLNEGIWHQIRRGRLIKYSKPNGITRAHIQEAASYLFRTRPDLLPHQRRLKFKCGYMAYLNFLQIFKDEFNLQTQTMNLLMGTDRQLPSNPIHGELDSLKLKPVIITEVPIPDIGVVSIEHDSSLDYLPLTERYSQGFYGNGYAHTTHSAVIWDASSDEYSNAMTNMPAGTSLVEQGNSKSNIYYVKPEGANMWWGYESGRWNPDTASGIVSSSKHMGREFWCHSISAGWVRDISKYIVIELKQ